MTTEMISFLGEEESDQEDDDKGLPWASREVLAGAGFSEKSDVYSFGIVLWEIMQADGSLPYDGLSPGQVSQSICTSVPPIELAKTRSAAQPPPRLNLTPIR